MKTAIINKRRKILRRIYGALSLTSAVFVFQACYGTPEDFNISARIQGIIISKKTNQPISGIKVSIYNQPQYDYTDSTGYFKIYASEASEYKLIFEGQDSLKNGSFMPKDTILKIMDGDKLLNIVLDEK